MGDDENGARKKNATTPDTTHKAMRLKSNNNRPRIKKKRTQNQNSIDLCMECFFATVKKGHRRVNEFPSAIECEYYMEVVSSV